jgi:hypothetical protein
MNEYAARFLTVVSAVGSIVSFNLITQFPSGSIGAVFTAIAAMGFVATFGYLAFVRANA